MRETTKDTKTTKKERFRIFDRRPELSWDERIGWKTVEQDGCTLHVVRC